ncbi:MAG: hypothetical protein ACO1O3_08395 [Sphingobium sp.]
MNLRYTTFAIPALLSSCVPIEFDQTRKFYNFTNGKNEILIERNFKYAYIDGNRKNLENCSDAFTICVNGFLSFYIPKNDCKDNTSINDKLFDMEFAGRDHHINISWRYNSRHKEILYEYDEQNRIIAIYYDFLPSGNAISAFINLQNGRVQDIASFRLQGATPISATQCDLAG